MKSSIRLLAIVLPFCLSPALHAAPIAVPYSNNFTSDPGSAFTTSSSYNGIGTGSIGWNSLDQTYQSTLSDAEYGQVNTNWATVAASNLNAANSNFYLSSSFRVSASSNAGGTASVGLGVASSVNFQSYSAANYYMGRFRTLDTLGSTRAQLDLFQSNGAAGVSLVTPITFAGYTDGTTYNMTLSGQYTDNNLLLTFSISDGVTSQSVSATVNNQPYANLANFGYQHQISNWASNTVQFDNFTLSTVPEPSSMMLLGLGGVLVSGLLRRRLRAR